MDLNIDEYEEFTTSMKWIIIIIGHSRGNAIKYFQIVQY